MDSIAQFKTVQKQTWAGFAVMETFTGLAAPRLVRFAGVKPGAKVLDVACGSGVVSLTAARAGASVTGLDLTPELITRANENSRLAGLDVTWREGDVEEIPFGDAEFDIVVSQYGHMFAPRPEVAIGEMLRVLRPGGTIAFATWPPELFIGRMFTLLGSYAPAPLPPGVSPPPQWGDPHVVRERLTAGGASAVKDIVFDRDVLKFPALSPQHYRQFMEQRVGAVSRTLQTLEADPARQAALRREFEELVALYFTDNYVRQDYLLTRAVKV